MTDIPKHIAVPEEPLHSIETHADITEKTPVMPEPVNAVHTFDKWVNRLNNRSEGVIKMVDGIANDVRNLWPKKETDEQTVAYYFETISPEQNDRKSNPLKPLQEKINELQLIIDSPFIQTPEVRQKAQQALADVADAIMRVQEIDDLLEAAMLARVQKYHEKLERGDYNSSQGVEAEIQEVKIMSTESNSAGNLRINFTKLKQSFAEVSKMLQLSGE